MLETKRNKNRKKYYSNLTNIEVFYKISDGLVRPNRLVFYKTSKCKL